MDSHRNRRRETAAALNNKRQSARDAQRNRLREGLDASFGAVKAETVAVKENVAPALKAAMERRSQMEQWRLARDKKRQAEAKAQRPVFRVGRAQGSGPTLLPPVKGPKPTSGFQHVTARIDTGLKSLKADIQFANTSKNPIIFTGADKYLTSDEDTDSKEPKARAAPQNPRRPSNFKARGAVVLPRTAHGDPEVAKVVRSETAKRRAEVTRQRACGSKRSEMSVSDKETVKRRPSQPSKGPTAKAPPEGSALKEETTAPISGVTGTSETAVKTPNTAASARRTPGQGKKRQAPEEELLTDDDSFSLGCTPSGKVRRTENGKPVPVIRKSFEIRRLKTTEERVAALMNSPMVEFRRRKSGNISSPMCKSEEEEERRNSLLEMRAEVMEKVAEDYVKSPEAQVTEDGLPRLDPSSARKIRRKSRLLQEAFESKAQETGQPVAALSAQHFRRLLMDETGRLTQLRCTWEPLSTDISIPTNAHAEIAAVIGQTELLFRHKFFFYERMIAKHESGASGGSGALEGRLVTAEDLLGYWEVMHLEIDNLDRRYASLEKWRAKDFCGALSDLNKAPAQASRPVRKKIVQKRKKPVTSRFAAFRKQMRTAAKEEHDTDATESTEPSADIVAEPAAPAVHTTPNVLSGPAPALRSALKSSRCGQRQSAAVRFAASSPAEAFGKDGSPASAQPRRPLTPFRQARDTFRRAAVSVGTFASPTTLPTRVSRSRSLSVPKMPASPRTPPPSAEVAGRPKTGTPFPEPRASSAGSRRRIADLRSQAGLTLRTEEASRRQSASASPPMRRGAARERQSSVRFTDTGDSSEEGHPTLPMTPYNRSSLVPMPRRSRPSSAPRSTRERSNGTGSRVRFDSEANSPPPGVPSAPVTPFSKDSLVPLPRRYRQSSTSTESQGASAATVGATFVETITPPLTPRLVDVTPLRRSARRRTNAADQADVSLL